MNYASIRGLFSIFLNIITTDRMFENIDNTSVVQLNTLLK